LHIPCCSDFIVSLRAHFFPNANVELSFDATEGVVNEDLASGSQKPLMGLMNQTI